MFLGEIYRDDAVLSSLHGIRRLRTLAGHTTGNINLDLSVSLVCSGFSMLSHYFPLHN